LNRIISLRTAVNSNLNDVAFVNLSLSNKKNNKKQINHIAGIKTANKYAGLEIAKGQEENNHELIASTINYWLLEQEKQNKRSYMNPHLSLLINNRISSYQHRVNFLKVNQLGFIYSKGLIKKNLIINKFFEKFLQTKLVYKNSSAISLYNSATEFIKEYKKTFKKGYMKKHLRQDIRKLKIKNFRNILIDLYFSDNLSNLRFNNLVKVTDSSSYIINPLTKREKLILKKFLKMRKNLLKNRKRYIKFVKSIIKERIDEKIKKGYLIHSSNPSGYAISTTIQKSVRVRFEIKSKNRVKLPLLFAFLIDKNLAINYLKLLFRLKKLYFKKIFKRKLRKLRKNSNKKVLKAVGMKHKVRKK